MITDLQVVKHPLDWYVTRLSRGTPFALSRYGDGEFMAAMGMRGKNCDGHILFAKMGAELVKALQVFAGDDDFIFATSPIAKRTLGKDIVKLLNRYGLDITFHHTGTLTQASIDGNLAPLIQELSGKRVLYVGPERLRTFVLHHFATAFVPIPLENCYLEKGRIMGDVYNQLDRKGYDVVCFSASMAANTMIADLWANYYRDVYFLDLGSLFDIYATGIPTRSYMRRMEIDRLLHANFPGVSQGGEGEGANVHV